MAAVDDLRSAELAFLATGDERGRAPAPVNTLADTLACRGGCPATGTPRAAPCPALPAKLRFGSKVTVQLQRA